MHEKIFTPELDFPQKYDHQHAENYLKKHEQGIWRRISNWREHQLAKEALRIAGEPKSVLDVPCGTGRFWDVLAEDSERTIFASDYSQAMIDTGMANRPREVVERVQIFQVSASSIPVDDEFVECVFCFRLIHHFGQASDRLALLSELRRVASDSVILSLWVDGNYQAWRRKKLEVRRTKERCRNRFAVSEAGIEEEFRQVRLAVGARLDFLRHYSMWRTYVLKKRG